MNQKFFKGTSLIKLVLFLFLGICSINTKGQCITPRDTAICFGDSITLCAVDTIMTNPTYIWSTGDTTACISVNPASTTTYSVTVQDSSLICNDSVTVTVNPQINITATVNNNSSQNACNGAIFASVIGVVSPYTFNWDTSGATYAITQNILNLCENTYCLTVTDTNACTADTCFNVESNPCDLNLFADSIDCNGGTTNIQAIVDTTAGIGPFPYLPAPRFVYSIYSLNPTILIQSQPFGLSLFTFNNPLIVAGDYLVTVYDNSWQDSCSNTISISEPDPILIYTTITNTSATWNNDGSILIDSITGGVGGFSIIWYDSSYTQSPPGTAILSNSMLLDSIYFSHDYYGGYSITITDTNGCSGDTTLYVYPNLTTSNFDTVYVNQHETCFGFEDGKIFASMNDSAIPPFTFYWMELLTGDTIRIDCMGCPPPSNYNPSHVATHTNLSPGFYSLSASDALGSNGTFVDLIRINPADSIFVVITPDVDSLTLNCSENILLSATAYPLPNDTLNPLLSAQLMPDTQLVTDISGNNSFLFDFNSGLPNGATYSLYDSPQRTYFLECTGTLTDTSNPPLNYDAAFMDWPPIAQNSIWAWNISNGGTVPLLNSSAYDGVNHTYTWAFQADSNSATQNGLDTNYYDHEFIVNTTILSGNLSCQVFGVVDTVIYDYEWTTVANPGVILSDADTLLTDSSIIITTDYVVTVTNTNGCIVSDTIRVKKDLNTLTLNPIVITPVRPCYGDLTGEIHIEVVDGSGVQPFTYVLYDLDTNFIQSTSDTFFTGLASGNYVIQVQDTIGCLNPFALVFVNQPDTIFACGVDELNDTTFNLFTHTVIANDSLTWIFQMGVLAPNFLYYLEIDSNFTLHSVQSSAPYNQDAAFDGLNGQSVVNPIPGPYWIVNGDVLRPDIDIVNNTNTYIYNNPSAVNGSTLSSVTNDYFTGSGNTLNFEFFGLNNPLGNTLHNQGGLVFKLHKIACTQIDTAYTCKGEGLGFAYVRPQSVNGNLGGIPYAGTDGVLGTSDDYYETAWIQYNPNTGANIDTIQGGPGAGASDTIVGLFAGSYRVVVIDSLGCSEFVRYLEVLEPIDTFITILDTVIHVSCKYDSTGEIHLSNYGGFDSIAFNGTSIVPIASTASRYAVLLRDNAVYNACGDVNAIIPPADYSDTIIAIYGVLDSIIFDNLNAHRYRIYIYDSIPDATYGQYDPFTGELLTTPFNYMQCPNIIDVFISEPCDSLFASTTMLSNIICWGDSTGSAIVSAIGGAEPWTYTYQWHNAPFGINGIGEVTAQANSLWADTLSPTGPNSIWHTVTVTDPNGCTVEDSVEIKNTNPKIRPFYVVFNPVDTIWDLKFIEDSVSCFDLCDGVVSLETFGGVLPHHYVWDVNPNTIIYNQPDTVDELCAGGHDVLITDNIGCKQRITFRIEGPNQLFAVASEVSPISCFGFNDGTAYAYAIGGNNLSNAYTFNWFIDSLTYNTSDSLLGVGQNIDSLPPGIHIVQITDYKGCVATDTVEIIEPTQLSVIIVDTSTVYAYCEFTESAKLCAQAFGGTPGYVYQWDDIYFQNNSNSALFENSQFCANNLTPFNTNTIDGSYNVIVIDVRGCVASDVIDIDTITNTFNTNTIFVSVSDVSCFGDFDGAITIDSVTGGTPSYNFTWTGPGTFSQNIQNINTLIAGSYAVIIEDSMGCERTKNIEVYQPDQLYYAIYNSIDETCTGDGTTLNSNGSCDGQIMVNISGGTGNYYWDVTESNSFPILTVNQVQIINDTLIKDLCSGVHNIYLTDDKNCEGQVLPGGVGNITINPLVNVNIPGVLTTATTCSYGNDGTASILFPGADPLFNYSWILDPYQVPTSVIGNQSFASLNTIVDVGASTSILAQDNYVIVAHYADAASFGINYLGCDATALFTIGGPSEIVPIATVATVSCWGVNDGSINLSVSGGTPATTGPNYTYLWDNTVSLPSGATTPFVNNLLAGTYTVTITDANGCDTTLAILVTQPSQIQNDFTIDSVLCYGDATGSITPITSGGTPTGVTPSYIYNWGGINPLAVLAGTYSITITDANGCSITDTAIVDEPNPLLLSLNSVNNYGVDATGGTYFISCYGANDGGVLAVATGGSLPYAYAWDDPIGQTANPAISLSEGSINCTLTDGNNCTIIDSVLLIEPSIIIDNATLSTNSYGYEVSCFGASDGWISLNPTGGVPESNGSYSYNWSNSSLDSVSSGIPTGNYSVSIVDANGCSYLFNYTLISPSEAFNASVSTLNYAGPSHPPVNVTFSDSTTDNLGNPILVNHNWYWTNDGAAEPFTNSGFTTFEHVFSEVGSNNAYVLVQNANSGCIDTVNFIIEVQGIDYTTNVFSPNGDGINDEFIFDKNGIKVISVEIYNRWGSLVMNWTDLDKGWDGRGSDGQDVPHGVYFYVLTAEGEDGHYYENKGSITLLR